MTSIRAAGAQFTRGTARFTHPTKEAIYMGVNVWNVKVGDKVREQGKDYDLTVHHIDPPTSGGRAMRYGPTIYVWIGPGCYGTTFDAETSHRFDKV
ncbi:hypothetical protein [Mycobacteroides abscessus]|nr:hypothetical protein [Mycobacteroides abscessus]MDO3086073.1 hypothetical protein [Mycobacteroides abscessus subsp. abscessus]MDO3105303.1 hypothetical protein [Mycobacteroides abscessus subsp. abscessus]